LHENVGIKIKFNTLYSNEIFKQSDIISVSVYGADKKTFGLITRGSVLAFSRFKNQVKK